MEIVFFNGLCDEAKELRTKVFVEEQKFVNEFDEIDSRAVHVVIKDNGKAVATGRTFVKGGDDSIYTIGRVAVDKEYRKTGLGRVVMESLESKAKELGASFVSLSAQLRAKDFYIKCGYSPCSQVYFDEDCPHIAMKKQLV